MTFDELLILARHRLRNTRAAMPPIADDPVDAWLIDKLDEAQPCGFEPPVVDPGMVSVMDGSNDPDPAYQFTPSEARWFAGALLRAADEAEAKEKA